MSLSILIAEDNEVVRDALKELLEQEGYDVSVCETGSAALQHLRLTSVDLLIADLLMPEMDGIELIKMLRIFRPDLKVIAISGDLNNTIQRRVDLLGVKATLQKPFTSDELFLTVRSVAAESGRVSSSVRQQSHQNRTGTVRAS